jgi:hypothetical protein
MILNSSFLHSTRVRFRPCALFILHVVHGHFVACTRFFPARVERFLPGVTRFEHFLLAYSTRVQRLAWRVGRFYVRLAWRVGRFYTRLAWRVEHFYARLAWHVFFFACALSFSGLALVSF